MASAGPLLSGEKVPGIGVDAGDAGRVDVHGFGVFVVEGEPAPCIEIEIDIVLAKTTLSLKD